MIVNIYPYLETGGTACTGDCITIDALNVKLYTNKVDLAPPTRPAAALLPDDKAVMFGMATFTLVAAGLFSLI